MEVAPPKNHSYQPADPAVFHIARKIVIFGAVAGMIVGILSGIIVSDVISGESSAEDLAFLFAQIIPIGIAGGISGGVFMALTWRVVMILFITANCFGKLFAPSPPSKAKE